MRWLAVLLAAICVGALAACGSGRGDVVEAAYERREKAFGEYLLADVEVHRVRLGQSQAKGYDEKIQREDLREAMHDEHECIEGNAFESCAEREEIEEIVKEMAASIRRK
jgi:hypothetical protein